MGRGAAAAWQALGGGRAVVQAFATVPRERFLGPGPWQILAPVPPGCFPYRTTDDADRRHLYHTVLVAIDQDLAARARENLAHLNHVAVVAADGSEHDPGPSDAIFVNAGATHPRSVWLDSLRPGGDFSFRSPSPSMPPATAAAAF